MHGLRFALVTGTIETSLTLVQRLPRELNKNETEYLYRGGGWKRRGEGAQRQGTAGIRARKGRTMATRQSQFQTASPR